MSLISGAITIAFGILLALAVLRGLEHFREWRFERRLRKLKQRLGPQDPYARWDLLIGLGVVAGIASLVILVT